MSDKLTIKQEKYAQGLFAGLSQREAYKQAYNCEKMTDKSVDELACVLAGNIKVISRVQELQEDVSKANIWTVEEILKDIKAIAIDPDAKRFEKLKALELGGKAMGMFTDKLKIDANVTVETNETDEEAIIRLQKGMSAEQRKMFGMKE